MIINIKLKGGGFMPGFDGTGPMGQGPMTGGGRGYCAVPANNGQPQPAGRGRGMRRMFYSTGMPGWMRAQKGMRAFGNRETRDIQNKGEA